MNTSYRFLEQLEQVRAKSPLVHNITNYVVMNNTANALLAIGASPVMAHSTVEVEEMAGIASSLVINIGTLSPEWVKAMLLAGKKASQRGIPVVLDPVGAGATAYRTQTCLEIIAQCKPTIIRGNASEIMALVDATNKTKGVDSIAASDVALNSAQQLAKETGAVVVISGPTDYITDGTKVAKVHNGSTLMTRVTGLGCTATAVVGAFAAVSADAYQAAIDGMTCMGVSGEIAAKTASGPGSMQSLFLDTLYQLSKTNLQVKPNIEE